MDTCPNLNMVFDRNVASFPNTHGPSIQSKTVTDFGIVMPFLTVQKVPIGKAFPALKSLKITEESINFFSVPKRIGDLDLGGKDKVEDYIEQVLGHPEDLEGVEELSLIVVLPNEQYDGQWSGIKDKQVVFDDVVSRFRTLDRLKIDVDPVYTRDPAMAFMLVSLKAFTPSRKTVR